MEAKFLGTTDDVTTCECCGRANLKATVAISIDGAAPVFFGTTCAARALGRTAKEIKTSAARADREIAEAKQRERDAEHARFNAAWQAFLDERAPAFARSYMGGPDRHRQIAELGGYTVARAAFDASGRYPVAI